MTAAKSSGRATADAACGLPSPSYGWMPSALAAREAVGVGGLLRVPCVLASSESAVWTCRSPKNGRAQRVVVGAGLPLLGALERRPAPAAVAGRAPAANDRRAAQRTASAHGRPAIGRDSESISPSTLPPFLAHAGAPAKPRIGDTPKGLPTSP